MAAASVAAPSNAAADWVVTPFLGWNFNGKADLTDGVDNVKSDFERKIDYGVSLASMGAGVVGFEVDFGYSPNFFKTDTGTGDDFDLASNSNVTTLTANAIVGIPIGGQRGGSVRPYVVGGVGLIRSNVGDVGDFFDAQSKNDFGFDVGGGVMGFFNSNVGLRGDVRYFRSFQGADSGSLTGIGLGNLNFWRGSLGVSFKF